MTDVPGPPKKLGRFEVGAKIGGGGMASVYVGTGHNAEGEEELVALKVIRDELADDEQFTMMFADEAKILSRLSHPNVIHTLEYGVTHPHRFIAMELLSGRTFADVWDVLVSRGQAVPVKLGAWIVARVAEGLHSAHELTDETGAPLSVIHRDVNPTNIFLTHAGTVKLIDFGLARARVRMSKSVDGVVKGKIPYLAPEQAQGLEIDRRVDVYALGATLWEAATRRRLFKRETDVATLLAIREAHVPDVRELVPGFPDELWRIIAKALAKERDARYPTAADVMADLDAFVGRGTQALQAELCVILQKLFPGQEAKQAQWMRTASSVQMPMHTLPPPAPVPTASSSMFDDGARPPSSMSVPVAAPVGRGAEPSDPPAQEIALPAQEIAPPDRAAPLAPPAKSSGAGVWLFVLAAVALLATWYLANVSANP